MPGKIKEKNSITDKTFFDILLTFFEVPDLTSILEKKILKNIKKILSAVKVVREKHDVFFGSMIKYL